ncbi:MAG TPA: thiamine pyrophosphate-dependent dehydrogenase E1 component subunit alpha, partial [Chitinophagaceae bacterium]|nr:thiamine pyrophosphate-dependent dehydrogenase E1 component subunit alpha [Chitinophagaceae bacterium]
MVDTSILLKAFRLMCQVQKMAQTYEANRNICKYVHSTSRGHEAIQLATAFQLQPQDFVSPYYRDESLVLGLGFGPYVQMLQLLAKKDDVFTGGREYYSHPNYKGDSKPRIIHQSSATGMQVIPTTGIAQGIQYWENVDPSKLKKGKDGEKPIVICSLGDASVTEGEVSEAWQFAVLKQLPIIYLVQDNNWGISATAGETRAMNAYEFAVGFKGMNRTQVDGTDFEASYETMKEVSEFVRRERKPFLVHASVPLLGHHTSGVRKDFYRSENDWALHLEQDPFPKLKIKLLERGIGSGELDRIEQEAYRLVAEDFSKAVSAAEPDPAHVGD